MFCQSMLLHIQNSLLETWRWLGILWFCETSDESSTIHGWHPLCWHLVQWFKQYLPEGINSNSGLRLSGTDECVRVPYMDGHVHMAKPQTRSNGTMYNKRLEKKYYSVQIIRHPHRCQHGRAKRNTGYEQAKCISLHVAVSSIRSHIQCHPCRSKKPIKRISETGYKVMRWKVHTTMWRQATR